MSQTMQAITARNGSFVESQMPRPVAKGHDILIAVKAVSVNPVDLKILQRAKDSGEDKVLGFDAVGIVEAVGDAVSRFKVGDRVWYAGDVTRTGSHAQYQLVDARIASHAPAKLSDAQAAALPLTAITAWELLFERLQLPTGPQSRERTLLVVGAAGGVGSILLQLASQLTEATVIATASRPQSVAWVKEMGADHVINHRQPLAAEFASQNLGKVTDVVSLTHTDTHFDELVSLLEPQGRLALIDDPKQPLDIGSMKQKSLSLHWEFMFTRPMFATQDMAEQGKLLQQVADYVDDGILQTTLQQSLGPLNVDNLQQALDIIRSGHSLGKVALTRG